MKIVYTPEGTDPANAQRWEWQPGKLEVPEVIDIEQQTGLTFEEWVAQLERGSAAAMRAFLWAMLKRDSPRLGISSVVFTMSEITVEHSDEEKRNIIRGMRWRLANEPLNDVQVAQIEATMADLRADLPDDDPVDDIDDDRDPATVSGEVVPAPKAASPSA